MRITQKSKSHALMAKIGIALLAGAFSIIPRAEALPVLEDGGASADVAVLADNSRMDIASTTENNVLKWTDFSIAKGETVAFDAHNYLNLVTGANRSDIFGALSGAGNIYIINPNGILFGAGAQINVGHLYASTRALPTDDQLNAFLSDGTSPLTSAGAANADIINCGTLKADTVLLEGNRVSIRNYAEVQKTDGALLTDGMTIRATTGDDVHIGYDGTAPTELGYKIKNLAQTEDLNPVTYKLLYELPTNGNYLDPYTNYMLANDIEANGVDFKPASFQSRFDGLVYKIKNLSVSSTYDTWTTPGAGLFTTLNSGAVIENLTLEGGSFTTTGGGSTGSIAAEAKNGVTLRNVHSTAAVSGSRSNSLGGLVGDTDGLLTIKDSSFAGSVTGNGNVGGLVGSGNNLSIENSFNAGAVAFDDAAAKTVSGNYGGLIGQSTGNLILTNVRNEGVVTAGAYVATDSDPHTYAVSAGGLVGYIENRGSTEALSISKAYNSKAVTVNTPAPISGYGGGLVGRLDNKWGNNISLTEVYNQGNISVTAGQNAYAGGLLGQIENTNSGSTTLAIAYNAGDVSSKSTATATDYNHTAYSYAGGLIGRTNVQHDTDGTITIENTYSSNLLGGGNSPVTVTADNAFDEDTNLSGKAAGGLLGYGDRGDGGTASNTSLKNSWWYSGTTAEIGAQDADDSSKAVTESGVVNYSNLLNAYKADNSKTNPHDVNAYANWSIDSNGGSNTVWRIYQLHTPPMLRAFLKSGENLTVSKEYNGQAQSISYDDLGKLGIYGDTTGNLGSTTFGNRTNAGSDIIGYNDGGAISLSGLTWSGQDGVDYDDINFTITPKAITAAFTKTYDGNTTTEAATVTFSGLLGSDSAKLSGTGNYWTQDAAGNLVITKNAGTGYLVNTGGMVLDNGNYQLAGIGNTGTIEQKALTASFADISKTYDGTTTAEAGELTLSGVVSGDTVTATAAGAAYDSRNAGERTVNYTGLSLSGTDAGNYTLADTAAGKGTINRKDVTLTADAVTITEGDEIPALTGKAAGLVDGDADNATYTTEATSQSKAGSYAIEGTLNNDNYNAKNAEANSTALTIEAKAPAVDPGDTPSVDPGDTPGSDPGDTPSVDPGDTPGSDPGDTPSVDPGNTDNSTLQQTLDVAEKVAASTVQETAAEARSVSSVTGVSAEAASEPVSMESGGTNTEGLDAMAVSEGDNEENNAKDKENTEGDENA